MTPAEQATEEEFDEDADASGEEDDGDIDAEAEEMARRIGAQLWENIRAPTTAKSDKENAILTTIKKIVSFAEKDSLVHSIFASTLVPGLTDNLLQLLTNTISSGQVSKEAAAPLSQIVVNLARSEALFPKLSETGKRKREEADDGEMLARKRPYIANYLTIRMNEAVQAVGHALTASPPKQGQPLDAVLISSIQLSLHQIFIFVMTASSRGGPDVGILQQIGGLIQILGVLSGIQIGTTPQSQLPAAYPQPVPMTDIGTAVYPCTLAGCKKTFSRLYGLRSHQRLHAIARPFHCLYCPARFARNHDLKRHTNMHSKKAWKCGGCDKIFSRRDAIRRHKNTRKNSGDKFQACVDGEVIEVAAESTDNDPVREERRAKMWNEISEHEPAPVATGYESTIEDGELDPAVLSSVQADVESLHGVLQAHALNALGASKGQTDADASTAQATLASIIARVQLLASAPASSVNASSEESVAKDDKAPFGNGDNTPATQDSSNAETSKPASAKVYGLSDEQTKMLELAIASAASAAQAQAEAEAALEEDEDGYDNDDEAEEEEETLDYPPEADRE